MKAFILCLLIVLIASQTNPVPSDPQTVDKKVYCGRTYTTTVANNGYTMALSGNLQCTNYFSRRSKTVTVGISSAFLPSIGVSYRSAIQTDKGSAGVDYKNLVVFDHILEYIDINGVAGYQPGDTIVRTHWLWNTNRITQGQSTWTPILYQLINTTDSKIHVLSFNLTKSNNDVGNVYFGLNVAEKEVSVPIQGSTSSRIILTPSSAKFTLDITGIVYSNPNSTGLAIGAVYASLSNQLNVKNTTTPTPGATYRPNDPNSDQQVYGNTDPNDNVEGGYYSFRNKFRVQINNQLQDLDMVQYGPETLGNLPAFVSDSNLKAARFYYSTTKQVQSLTWDPTVGASEDSAEKAFASLFLLVALFMLLL